MTLTVRLPDRIEQELAEYCVKHRLTKSDAVIEFLDLARSPRLRTLELPVDAYSEVGSSLRKYADRDIDFSDAALI